MSTARLDPLAGAVVCHEARLMQKLSISGPAELLAIIPYQLGFVPTRSVVLVSFHDRCLGLVARLDIPPSELVSDAAGQLLEVVQREAPSSAVLVGFEQDPGESRELLDALTTLLDDEGIVLRQQLVVRGGRWYCADACGTCPSEGEPMPECPDVPAVAGYVALGRSVLPSREAVEDLFAVSDDAEQEVVLAIDDFVEELVLAKLREDGPRGASQRRAGQSADGQRGGAVGGGARPAVGRSDHDALVHGSFEAWSRLMRGDFDPDLPAAQLPALLGGLRDVHVRDAIIAWLSPTTLALEELPPRVVEALAEHVDLPGRAERSAAEPSWFGTDERDLIQTRLELLCRHSPDEHAAPILGIAASFAWANGNGTRASAALDRAFEVEPQHRLCHLLRQMVDHGIRSGQRSA